MSRTKHLIHIVTFSNENLIAVSNDANDLIDTLQRQAPRYANDKIHGTIMRTIEAQTHAVDDKHVEVVEKPKLDVIDTITTIYNDPERNPYPFAISGGEPDEVIKSEMHEMTKVLDNTRNCKVRPACGSDVVKNALGKETMITIINAQRFMTNADTSFVTDYDKLKEGTK